MTHQIHKQPSLVKGHVQPLFGQVKPVMDGHIYHLTGWDGKTN